MCIMWICTYSSGVLVLSSLAVFQSNELKKGNNWAVMIMPAELVKSCIRFLLPVSWHGNLNLWVAAMAGSRKFNAADTHLSLQLKAKN